MNRLRQELYLLADELRGMATLGQHFAANVYERERAERIMSMAAEVAALAEESTADEVRAIFDATPWFRVSPALGVDALVLDQSDRILLIQRKDSGLWAMPGGIAEIGHSPAESAVKELWEEAGLRGRTGRLLGVFDNRVWRSATKVQMVHLVFLVECDQGEPSPGVECLDARFFSLDALPEMHGSHGPRLSQSLQALRDGTTYVDPASAGEMALPPHQRPDTVTAGDDDR